jgi:flagellar hook assembly protein FlgD
VELFDVQGRRVTTLADGGFGAGAHVLAWDGRDAAGARASRGLYFVRLTTPTGVRTTRFLLDR